MKLFALILLLLLTSDAFAQIPSPPTNLSIIGGKKISLTWTDNSNSGNNEICFPVELKSPGSTEWKTIACVPQDIAGYTDIQYLPGNYCYRVKAFNVSGNSTYSNEACVTLVISPPAAPALTVLLKDNFPVLQWTNDMDALGVHIFRYVNSVGGYWDHTAQTLGMYIDRRVAEKVTYCYQIQFWNHGGLSTLSSRQCVATLKP